MIEIRRLMKRFGYNKVINDINMTLPDYGLIAIIGPSGCGKSTLLHIIGGIDKKYQGSLFVDNKPLRKFGRKKSIGFLFQSFHLISWLNAQQNIQLPIYYRKNEYLTDKYDLDIKNELKKDIYQLSLGQRQRIAFLRTMIFNPRIILCDEPTASLDEKNAKIIMELLKEESKKRLIIFVSHNIELVEEYSDEIYMLSDGYIKEHIIKSKVDTIEETSVIKKTKRPKFLLSYFSMKKNKTRLIQLCISLVLSFTAIFLSLSLIKGLHQQLNLYIESIIPSSAISFRLKNHSNITSYDFNNETFVNHVHYYPNDYELLGIGSIKERYTMTDSISIYDDSGFILENNIINGRLMENDEEIVVSKLAAIRYIGSNEINEILNEDVMVWFKYRNEVKGKRVKVVGVSDNSDMESIYYYDQFNIIKDIYDVDSIDSSYGVIYVDDLSDLDILIEKYKEYEFNQIGKSTQNQIDSFMYKAKVVLFLFSLFSILSSLFLIGEVMFLEVMLKRKEIAVMKCFGANSLNICGFILYQFIMVFVVSVSISLLLFVLFSQFINIVLSQDLLVNIDLIVVDFNMILKVIIIGFFVCLSAMMIPMLYALNINTIEALKIKS